MSSSEELQYIYSALRRVKCIEKFESFASLQPNSFSFDASLFPKVFLLKSIDERLEDIEELANEFCTHLFKQIGGKPKQIDEHELKQTKKDHVINERFDRNIKYPDLDEYFHSSLYHLHDFIIDINWHEADVDVLSKEDLDYVRENLKFFQAFLGFQKILNNLIEQTRRVSPRGETTTSGWFVRRIEPMSPSIGGSSGGSSSPGASSQRTLKSSLSSAGLDRPRVDSPTARRRVRFKLAEETTTTATRKNRRALKTSKKLADDLNDKQKQMTGNNVDDRDLRENHSILAFNLLLYLLNIFIQQLSNKLVEWFDSNDLNESINVLIESKQKLRTPQLINVAKRIKTSNDVYLTVLEYLSEIKQTYLIDTIYKTLIVKDSARLYNLYKSPRINIYLQKIGQDVECKILVRLVNQNLQIILDLIISDLNLPPVELDTETKTKTRDQIAKGTNNIINFVTNWFNIGDVLFGFSRKTDTNKTNGKTSQNLQAARGMANLSMLTLKQSTLSLGLQFKSNSRILNQMDNLIELNRSLLNTITNRIRAQQQLQYFLELFHLGIGNSFEIISRQLSLQIEQNKIKKEAKPADVERLKEQQHPGEISDVDLVTIRVRCLKFIHIMSSTIELLKELAARSKINIDLQSSEAKLNEFSDLCTKQASLNNIKISTV